MFAVEHIQPIAFSAPVGSSPTNPSLGRRARPPRPAAPRVAPRVAGDARHAWDGQLNKKQCQDAYLQL